MYINVNEKYYRIQDYMLKTNGMDLLSKK